MVRRNTGMRATIQAHAGWIGTQPRAAPCNHCFMSNRTGFALLFIIKFGFKVHASAFLRGPWFNLVHTEYQPLTLLTKPHHGASNGPSHASAQLP